MVSHETFERFVEEGIEAIPAQFRAKLHNVAFLVEDEPSDEVREREGLGSEETLLGYYHGIPNTARGSGYGIGMTLPDTITIYKRPIEEMAGGDPERIREIVFDTVWHEYGHFLGFDEDAIERRERKRRR